VLCGERPVSHQPTQAYSSPTCEIDIAYFFMNRILSTTICQA
jgi:hypothetical protein